LLKKIIQKMNAQNPRAKPEKMVSKDFEICLLDEHHLKEFADFFARAKGLPPDSPAVQPSYLKWKYLNLNAPLNRCFALRQGGQIRAVVGGIVQLHEIDNMSTEICFPVDWFSDPDNPVKGVGRKAMNALIDRYPASVAVGGSKICFEPQIKVGFKDVGYVPLLGVDEPIDGHVKKMAKAVRNWLKYPRVMWNKLCLLTHQSGWGSSHYEEVSVADEELLQCQAASMLSRGVSRKDLVNRWRYFMEQPCNPSNVLKVDKKGFISYALISRFTDSRKGFCALGDALVHPEHSVEDILAAAVLYARRRHHAGILMMTNNSAICQKAKSVGYRMIEPIRTQYYAALDGPECDRIESLPSVSLITHDELAYIESPENRKPCATCRPGTP
jgi:hypothetical protein